MNNIPCFLIPLIVGAICGLLGYLLGKMLSKDGDNSNELSLQAQLDACLANARSMSLKVASLEGNSNRNVENFVAPAVQLEVKKPKAEAETSLNATGTTYDAKKVAEIMEKKWKLDDLKIVEGIGPKIEELYHAAGIKTWAVLAETPTKQSQAILTAAGDKYKMHNPGSWAKQAKMASEGKWAALKKWQDAHKGGKE